jgi:cell division protein FtsW (lipid II flippase)
MASPVPATTPVPGDPSPGPVVREHGRRAVELALLVPAVAIPVFAYAQVGLVVRGHVPADLGRLAGGLALLALVTHLLVRRHARHADPLLLPIATLLNGMGLVLIHRLDLALPDHEPAAGAQLVWSAVGVGLFAAVMALLRDHRRLQGYAYLFAVASLALMVAPAFFPAINGAKVWMRVGPFSFQPGELAKITLTVFYAAYLVAKRDVLRAGGRRIWFVSLPRGRDLGPILVVWAMSLLVLVLERDMGTSLVFFGVFVVLLWVATARTGWVVIGLGLAAAGATLVAQVEPHVHQRVEDWLHPMASIEAGRGAGQLAQSLFAFGSGGLLGQGLGAGHSELIGFAVRSDFILATAGEELGLAGLLALLVLYALLIGRGLRAGLASPDPFGRLLAVGLSAVLAIQVFVVAGGVTALIPLTGMTMPFLAQGGSSVITNWALVALLMKISDLARRPAPPPVAAEPAATRETTAVGA